MKLRIRGDSLRLRLSQSEVAQLQTTGRVEETIRFAETSALTYAIEQRNDVDRVTATFDGGRVIVRVPEAIAREFSESDDVGFDAAQGPLKIMVEKDWQCLKPREGEDETDAYPHPKPTTP